MADPAKEWYGLELMQSSGLSSGTLYPLLHRLVRDGWLERTGDARSDAGGAGRRLYRLTGAGVTAAVDLLPEARSRSPRRARRAARSLRPGVQST